jgi:peptide/nickel transport system permease protein
VDPAPSSRQASGRTIAALLSFLGVRAALLVLLVLAAASAMMLATSLAPGDATSDLAAPGLSAETRARERARLGLDRPLGERYVRWLAGAVRLDLGESSRFQQPVSGLVLERAGNTALLALAALCAAALVGVPLGVIAGCGRWPRLSSLAAAVSLTALSVPPLLLSLLLALVAARTGWLPVGAMSSSDAELLAPLDRLLDVARHLVVPVCALAVPLAATLERLQAAAVAEGGRERHVLAARARGAPFARILVRDLWRPTVAPVAGVFGLAAGGLLSGSLTVEIVTSWPGLGRLMFEALGARDVPLAAGCAAAAAVFLAIWTTTADVVVSWLDPRVRTESRT